MCLPSVSIHGSCTATLTTHALDAVLFGVTGQCVGIVHTRLRNAAIPP
jgi:hypothetical protein